MTNAAAYFNNHQTVYIGNDLILATLKSIPWHFEVSYLVCLVWKLFRWICVHSYFAWNAKYLKNVHTTMTHHFQSLRTQFAVMLKRTGFLTWIGPDTDWGRFWLRSTCSPCISITSESSVHSRRQKQSSFKVSVCYLGLHKTFLV